MTEVSLVSAMVPTSTVLMLDDTELQEDTTEAGVSVNLGSPGSEVSLITNLTRVSRMKWSLCWSEF